MSTDDVTAYPLAWPFGRPRYTRTRQRAIFSRDRKQVTVARGTRSVIDELGRMGCASWNVIISSNVELRQDGLPYSNRAEARDPGVAVYFRLKKERLCLACDRYDRTADNMVAVAKTIEAKRGIVRWGVGSFEEHFAGFKALPAAGETAGRAWWDVLGIKYGATEDEIKYAYRRKAETMHPERGGSDDEWQTLLNARAQAMDTV